MSERAGAPNYILRWSRFYQNMLVSLWLLVYNGVMAHRGLILAIVIASTLLVFLLQTTTPSTIPPIGILAFFVLLYTLVLCGLTYFLLATSRLVSWLRRKMSLRASAHLTLRRAYLYASVLAFAPVIILAMQSVGTTGLTDILLVILFEAIACFYVWRRA